MRLRPGLDGNLTTMGHGFLFQQLFSSGVTSDLPAGIVPLCNSSSKDAIIAMMPVLDAHSIDGTWLEPPADQVQAFFDNLAEVPVHEESFFHATTEAELAYIAKRAEEARLGEEAGSSGFGGEDSSEEEEEDSP